MHVTPCPLSLAPSRPRPAPRQVVRLVLTATGSAGFFCAPREVILESMRKVGLVAAVGPRVRVYTRARDASEGSQGKSGVRDRACCEPLHQHCTTACFLRRRRTA